MINISYAITVNNEYPEIQTLLNKILNVVEYTDEIVIIQDNTNTNSLSWFNIKNFINKLQTKYNNIVYDNNIKLNKDFSTFKNYMISKCNKEWIMHFDADEYPNQILLDNIKKIIELNENKIDIFWVPRINRVINVTSEYIKRMNWLVNERGWINFPDYQQRIWKRLDSIRWSGKVHERLISENKIKFSLLPQEEIYSYYHIKTFEKQKQQNEFYVTIDTNK